MKRGKRYLYILLGFIGLVLAGATAATVIIQWKYETSAVLSFFCVFSWILYGFTVFQSKAPEIQPDDREHDQ